MESIGIDVPKRHLPLRDRFTIFAMGLNEAITQARHSGFYPREEDTLRRYFGGVVSYQRELNSIKPDPERVLSLKIAMLEAEGKVRDLVVQGDPNVHNIAVDLINTNRRLFSR